MASLSGEQATQPASDQLSRLDKPHPLEPQSDDQTELRTELQTSPQPNPHIELLREILNYMTAAEECVKAGMASYGTYWLAFQDTASTGWHRTAFGNDATLWCRDQVLTNEFNDVDETIKETLKFMLMELIREYGVEALLKAGYRDRLVDLQHEARRNWMLEAWTWSIGMRGDMV